MNTKKSSSRKKRERTPSKNRDGHASNASNSSESPRKKRKWGRRMIWAVLIFVGLWLIGDFAYSRYVASKVAEWEKNISRDENGVRVGCEEFSHGTGPTGILLVHGFNETPQIWYKIAPALIEQHFTVHAIRLPGFGETTEKYGQVSRQQWMEKFEQEIKNLQQKCARIIVVAHSLGGAITINQLLHEPGCVDGIVLLAPAIKISNERSPFLSTRFWHEFSHYTLPFSRVAMSPFEYDAKDPMEKDIKLRNKFTPRQVVKNTFELIDENRDRAAEIKTPARIFVSPTDQVVDTAAIKEYFERLGATNKKLIEADRSGHAIPVDYDWSKVVDEVVSFASELENDSG